MTVSTPAIRRQPEFIRVDLNSFPAGRPPLVDLYHRVDEEYVLYCEADVVFTEEARRRLLAHDVEELYVRASPSDDADENMLLERALALPDSLVPPLVKTGLLYNSAIATAQMVYYAPNLPEHLNAARQLAGTIAARLGRNPDSLRLLLQVMRHDRSIYTHAVNTCCYAAALGTNLGLGRGELTDLSLAAFLHDVGKLKVPRKVLDKTSPLTSEEWTLLRSHPQWSVELLDGVNLTESARLAILQHHERLDGSGYPEGLQSSQIEPLARAVALADVFDDLTGERPHRPSLSPFYALRLIKTVMAGQLDQDLFVTLVHTLACDERELQVC